MAKHQRRRIVQPIGPQPMYVIAGLPKAIHKGAIDELQIRLPQAIVKGIPAPTRDGALYSNAFLDQLVRSVGDFAVRRRTRGNAQPTPSSITLFFVPASDQEELLQRFDFALMSVPLLALGDRDGQSRQFRHNRNVVVESLVAAVAASSEAQTNLNQVTRRLSYQSDNEGLLLPPRNFNVQGGNLIDTFRAFRRGERPWTDRMEDFGPIPLTHDNVPKRIHPQQTRRVFVDDRGLAFFIAHSDACDGPAREVEEGENTDKLLETLRSLYRFGVALKPGLHHDVQRHDGRPLDEAIFECTSRGKISVNADYANVYPNDFVRAKGITSVE